MGRAISRLNGRYITGEDMGTNPSDMCVIREETNAVSCIGKEDGGYGDPAVFTALGALQAIRAGLEAAAGSVSLQGVRVAVQGVGNVGLHLCAMLAEEGASLIVCDTHQENTKRAKPFGAKIVDPDEIYGADADVFAPCAIGGILNERTIPQLHARVVAGAANNQLARSQDAEALARSGIVYIPDYVANGGGLISCAAEWYRTDWDEIRPKVLGIYDTCRGILAEASRAGTTTSAAADRIAKLRMQEGPRPNSVCAIQ
jgi:leucine dehydrogenase